MKDYSELKSLCEDVVKWPVKTADEHAWRGVAVQTLELLAERDALLESAAEAARIAYANSEDAQGIADAIRALKDKQL